MNHGLQMTDWTYETLSVIAQEKGIVESISKSHVRLLLKNTAIATAQNVLIPIGNRAV